MLLICVGLTGCAGRSAAADERELRATLLSVYAAVERGDEAGYRDLVDIPATDVYSNALTTTMFESIRLHQAVERHVASAANRSTTKSASLAAVDYRTNARAMRDAAAGWTFTAQGNRATIDQLASRPGAPMFRRARGEWRLVPTPMDAPPGSMYVALMVQTERRLAEALATARKAVEAGRATSIEDVNGILRNLLADVPTTRPASP